jgi:signal transduction histidine kinase
LKNSKRDGLDRVVALLESHQHDLPSFFAPTAPGSNLAQLLAGLSEQMEREHNERLKDAQRLEGLLDHVSEILRAQAANCSDVSVNAEIRPKELFEEALGICDRSHPIQDEGLIKDFDEVSTIVGDPNQILEILVYLIGNARDSMNECKDRGGRLALEIHRMPNEIIAFSVQDNGKGIEDEDLSRLFLLQQGATDKEAGGGFGLHGCANSATAMGGRIQVHSNAPEAGATFTLLLPLTTPDTLHTR